MCFRSSARLATHVLQSSFKCKPVNGCTSALPLVVLDPQYYREHWDVGDSSRSCWMEWTALGLERLQSPPFDLYATINNISVLFPLWWLYWDIILVSGEDRRPLRGSNVCFRSSARLASHVLQSSSKCKPVSGAIIALPLVVLDPQYYRDHWDVGASSRSCSSWTV